MCGIAGIAGPGANLALCEKMVQTLSHRGPDSSGIYEGDGLCLGHARLSIIDLSTGDQPMTNEDSTVWVALNGEIYNYQELRSDLQKSGHVFKTTSDTEVIVHGYEQYGLDILPMLDGIYAIALWDASCRRLILARDYFGIKPLHYQFDGANLRFASEYKAIIADPSVPKEVDLQALHYFMNLRYIPGTRTLLKNINRLEAGYYLIFQNQKLKKERFFTLKPADHGKQDEKFYIQGIQHYLEQAVKKQMVSDVPLGVYLSGGMDSSAIAAYMSKHAQQPVQTFSMGFNEPTDELSDAKVVAREFGTNHHEIALDADPLKYYPEVIWHAEEPKENILQGFLLAKFARQHVKVVQGGLGGDELFAGYEIHRLMNPSNWLHGFVPGMASKRLLMPASSLCYHAQTMTGALTLDEYRRGCQLLLSVGDPLRYYSILRNVWDHDKKAMEKRYGPELLNFGPAAASQPFESLFKKSGSPLEKALWAEFYTKMIDDFLMNEDRTSMAHGLEVRVPFLDRELVQFSMGIPASMQIRVNETKRLFRKAMKGVLPQHTLAKKKWGFTVNPYLQFQKDLKQAAQNVLTKKRVQERGWFNYDYLERIINHPPHPRLRWHYFFLWLAMGLEIWAQMFLENGSSPDLNLNSYF